MCYNCFNRAYLRETSVFYGCARSSWVTSIYQVRSYSLCNCTCGLTDEFSNRRISEEHDKVFATGCEHIEPAVIDAAPRANAAFVVLARNKELEGVIQSLKSIERHFNRWWHYPYVFLNDGDFDQEFIDTVQNYTSGTVEFGKIDDAMWGYPDWVDPEVAKEGVRKQGDAAIMYGGMESYHHMCRFYSGYFPLSEESIFAY